MNSVNTIERICRLPIEFSEGTKSFNQIVFESGVEPSTLKPEDVESVLSKYPTLVGEWRNWSDDQRCSPAYYFVEKKGSFVVGLYPGNESVEFQDPISACADFIIKSISK